jgi:hypothetical protein
MTPPACQAYCRAGLLRSFDSGTGVMLFTMYGPCEAEEPVSTTRQQSVQ